MSDLKMNLRSVQQRIADAALRAGRDPAEITLVAVTKTQPPRRIQEAVAAGAAEGRWECSLAAHEPAGKQERSCGSTLCVSATRLLSRPPL